MRTSRGTSSCGPRRSTIAAPRWTSTLGAARAQRSVTLAVGRCERHEGRRWPRRRVATCRQQSANVGRATGPCQTGSVPRPFCGLARAVCPSP
jgi:hypothetical protein